MSIQTYTTKAQLLKRAQEILNKNIRAFVPQDEILTLEDKIREYDGRRKGFLGELVEVYLFNLPNNGRPEADFPEAGVELKVTPIKEHKKLSYVAKERLVFSMIDYMNIGKENWETSSFRKKNTSLLLMFYLYLEGVNILDFNFKHIELLNLLSDLPNQDILQIKKDWEFIRDKIVRREAHLLSEGDTFYLGACTKSNKNTTTREQPGDIPAKPRAFSLKPRYLNFLIQKNIVGKKKDNTISLFSEKSALTSIEDIVKLKFKPYIHFSDTEIVNNFGGLKFNKSSKGYKRSLANAILTNTTNNKIEELEKANVTMRVITLESNGSLKESLSFPAFDYRELVKQEWYDIETDTMSDFHMELESRKFLFIVFQKQNNSKEIVLKKVQFWNFPIEDLEEARTVFEKTKNCINQADYKGLPKINESRIAHVRPHASNKDDTQLTPQGTMETKKSFWLNAKYIQEIIKNN